MKRLTAAVLLLSVFLGMSPISAHGNGFDIFDLSKPVMLSWSLPKGVTTASKVEDRSVKLTLADPWTKIDFATSFAVSERGQADNLLVMTGSTGITSLVGHSGYFHEYPQSLEWIRGYLQGGRPDNSSTRMILFDSGTEARQSNSIRDTKMTLKQGTTSKSWSMAFVVKVAYKDVEEFSRSADDAVIVTTRSMSRDQLQEFLKRTSNEEKPLLLVTCYWGSDLKVKGWGTHGRYAIVMFPDISPD